jgi:4-hydroxybenzoate polyprenyltransferase
MGIRVGMEFYWTDLLHMAVSFIAGYALWVVPILTLIITAFYFLYQTKDLRHKEPLEQTMKDLLVFVYGFLMGATFNRLLV